MTTKDASSPIFKHLRKREYTGAAFKDALTASAGGWWFMRLCDVSINSTYCELKLLGVAAEAPPQLRPCPFVHVVGDQAHASQHGRQTHAALKAAQIPVVDGCHNDKANELPSESLGPRAFFEFHGVHS